MLKTPNYNLNKPEYNDVADIIPAVGDNMDILDLELKKISDGNATIYPTTNIGNRYFATIPSFALQEGFPFALKFNAPSSGNITININNGGDKNVYDYFNNRVNNVRTNLIANFRYDSVNTNFQLLGKGGGGNALPSQILLGATATVDSGPIVGTIPSKGTQIYTPGTTDQTINAGQYLSGPQVLEGDPELLPPNIVKGIDLFGVAGSATIQSLGGYEYKSGSFIIPPGSTTYSCNLGFKPRVLFVKYMNTLSGGGPTEYSHEFISENFHVGYYKRTVSDWELANAITITSTGFNMANSTGVNGIVTSYECWH